ncbi:transcriptional regulator [Enterobacterales bacterium CwR94]|nr:transcriptional regulator [Enterobacterales bacterium CwR94]
MLDAGDLRLLILHFLAKGPAHGYELIKAIEDLSKGEYSPSPGMIYPNLTQLEESGFILAVDEEAARKAYRLHAAGADWLAANQTACDEVTSRLNALAILVDNRSRPEVERAINNMRSALNTRLAQADISRDSLHALIDALDEAAKKIERS